MRSRSETGHHTGGRGGCRKEALRLPRIPYDSGDGDDYTREQIARAAYDDPEPSQPWLHPYYVCACGFECEMNTTEAFVFKRVPHKCRLAE